MPRSTSRGSQKCHPNACQEQVERVHVDELMLACVTGDLVQEGIFGNHDISVQTMPVDMSISLAVEKI